MFVHKAVQGNESSGESENEEPEGDILQVSAVFSRNLAEFR